MNAKKKKEKDIEKWILLLFHVSVDKSVEKIIKSLGILIWKANLSFAEIHMNFKFVLLPFTETSLDNHIITLKDKKLINLKK